VRGTTCKTEETSTGTSTVLAFGRWENHPVIDRFGTRRKAPFFIFPQPGPFIMTVKIRLLFQTEIIDSQPPLLSLAYKRLARYR
jgi:hypothetical protein